MFSTLKLYYNQALRLLSSITERFVVAGHGENITLAPRLESSITPATIDIHYGDVAKAFLITECNEKGQETPLAVAFVKNNSEMVIAYLDELAEWE